MPSPTKMLISMWMLMLMLVLVLDLSLVCSTGGRNYWNRHGLVSSEFAMLYSEYCVLRSVLRFASNLVLNT